MKWWDQIPWSLFFTYIYTYLYTYVIILSDDPLRFNEFWLPYIFIPSSMLDGFDIIFYNFLFYQLTTYCG